MCHLAVVAFEMHSQTVYGIHDSAANKTTKIQAQTKRCIGLALATAATGDIAGTVLLAMSFLIAFKDRNIDH